MDNMDINNSANNDSKRPDTNNNTNNGFDGAVDVKVDSLSFDNNNNAQSEDSSMNNSSGIKDSTDRGDIPSKHPFYTENFQKPNRGRGFGLLQLTAVALISSILGGTIVGAFYQFVVPNVQPSVQGYFSRLLNGKDAVSQSEDSYPYNKVQIISNSDNPVTAIAEKVGPSIVGIRVTIEQQQQNFGFFLTGGQGGGGEGSGIIIRSDGYIMTNYHVIEAVIDAAASKNSKVKLQVFLPNQVDKPYDATIVGHDWKTDLAVLKINASGLIPAELGNSDELKVGELAVCIGNPGGMEFMGSVSVGVVSGLNRTLEVDPGKKLRLIQTDAAISPGNSGGALVNSKGQVIGINTVKLMASGVEGLGFAIPVNTAKQITDSLIEYKYVKGRPWLGIAINSEFNEQYAKKYKVPAGVLIQSVEPLSAADKAGLQKGDIITEFDGKEIKTKAELDELKDKHKVGDTIEVKVYRDSAYKTFKVILLEYKGEE